MADARDIDCSGRIHYSDYNVLVAFVCGTRQTWHSQHFSNSFRLYVATQNVLLCLLIAGVAEILEVFVRIWVTYSKRQLSGERDTLVSFEPIVGIMIYDWLVQGFGGVFASMLFVEIFGIYLRDPYFWTCRVLNGIGLFAITVVLEILFQFLEPRFHWAAVLIIATVDVLGFLAIRLWYESNQWCDLFCCCRCRSSCKAIYVISPPREERPGCNIYWQIGLYALIVYAVFIGGASTDKRNAYKYVLITEALVVLLLLILLALPRTHSIWSGFAQRNGCLPIRRFKRKPVPANAEKRDDQRQLVL